MKITTANDFFLILWPHYGCLGTNLILKCFNFHLLTTYIDILTFIDFPLMGALIIATVSLKAEVLPVKGNNLPVNASLITGEDYLIQSRFYFNK